MSSRHPDPLVQPHDPDRVNYANGVLLDEKDFREEQTYSRSRLARALSYLHGHGTVAGLNVARITQNVREEREVVADAHVLRVTPGLATDRLGRLIEVPIPYCIRAQKWLEEEYGFGRFDAYTLVGQLGESSVANIVDPIYTVVAKFPKRYLPSPED